MRLNSLKAEFVENVPDELEEGIVYISLPFRLAMHKCCCGCGQEVTTRISPTGWEFTYDGENVSFRPSIGPTTLACKSHYVVSRGKLKWYPPMTDYEIQRVQNRDARLRAGLPDVEPDHADTEYHAAADREGWFRRFTRWLLS